MTEKFNARSPGEILRAAREKQGLHIAALAASIKVAPRKLDALEHDRWDELPDATFVRALAQTVCRTLKIDPAPVMELLPRAGTPALQTDAGGLNTPFRERPGRDEPGLALGAVRPMVLAAALLMLAAVAVYFVPDRFWAGKSQPATAAAPAPAAAASAPAAAAAASSPDTASAAADAAASAGAGPFPAATASVPPAAGGDGSAALAAVAASPVAGLSASASAPAPGVPAATVAAAAVGAIAASRPQAGGGPVQLRARSNSWIEVRDAGGRVLFSRVLASGEQVGLDGSLPMRMTIGNASATDLDFRGQAFDLKPVTVNNVARVELK